jgi:radical SAM protein with 4Fe4S-binding SPASM domain
LVKEIRTALTEKELVTDFNKRHPYQNKVRKTLTAIPIINLQVAVTGRCNLRCKHCYAANLNEVQALDIGTIDNLAQQAAELGVVQFDLTGGEPLLRQDLFTICEILKDKGFEVALFTNGTLLSPETIERLVELEINQFRISLDGFEESHDALRGHGTHAKTIKAIEYLRRLDVPLVVNTILNKLNASEITQFMSHMKERYGVSVRVDTVVPVGSASTHKDLVLSQKNYTESLLPVFGKGTEYYDYNIGKLNLSGEKKQYLVNGIYDVGCGVACRMLYVESDGSVKFCPTLPHVLGNVFDDSIKDIWESIGNERRQVMQCRYLEECAYGLVCAGGCRSRAYEIYHALDAPDTYECSLLYKIFGRESAWHKKEANKT